MPALENFRERFTQSGWGVVERAAKASRRRNRNYVSLEHLIGALASAEPELFDAVMLDLGVDARAFKALLRKRAGVGLEHRGAGVRLAPEVVSCLKGAWLRVRRAGRDAVDSTDILVELALDKRGLFVEALRSLGADPDRVALTVLHCVGQALWQRTRNVEAVFVRFGWRAKTYEYAEGDTVRIKQGPFASFTGKVAEVLKEASRLKVVVEIFGRATPVELPFQAAEKI